MKTSENQKSTNHQPAAQKPFFGAGPEHAFFSAERAPSPPFFQPQAISPSTLEKEADAKGNKALQTKINEEGGLEQGQVYKSPFTVQRVVIDDKKAEMDLEAVKGALEERNLEVTPRGVQLIEDMIHKESPPFTIEPFTIENVVEALEVDYSNVGEAVEDLGTKLTVLLDQIKKGLAEKGVSDLKVLKDYNKAIKPLLNSFLETILSTDSRLSNTSFAVVANASFARGELSLHSDLDVGFVINSDDKDKMIMVHTVLLEVGELIKKAKEKAGIKGDTLEFDANMAVRRTLKGFVEANLTMQNVIQDIDVIYEQGKEGLSEALGQEVRIQSQEKPSVIRDAIREKLYEFNLPILKNVAKRGNIINVKTPYIRFLTLMTRDLAGLFVLSESSTQGRLSKLGEAKVMSTSLMSGLLSATNFLLSFRMKLHGYYGKETDTAVYKSNWIQKNPEGYIMTKEERELFNQAVDSLIEYRAWIENGLKEDGILLKNIDLSML